MSFGSYSSPSGKANNLKSNTKMSLNDRFMMLREKAALTKAAMSGSRVENVRNQVMHRQGSSRNKKLAMLMENKPSVVAALRIKRKSIKQRLGNFRSNGKRPFIGGRNQSYTSNSGPQNIESFGNQNIRFRLNRNNFIGPNRVQKVRNIKKRQNNGRISNPGTFGNAAQFNNKIEGMSLPKKKFVGNAMNRQRVGNNRQNNVNQRFRNKFGFRQLNGNQQFKTGRNLQAKKKNFQRATLRNSRGGGRVQLRGKAIQGKKVGGGLRWQNKKPNKEQLDQDLDTYMAKTRTHLDADLDAYMAMAEANQ